MYIGLWSRLEGFSRDQLTSALERRTVVQATLMRTTIHLVSRRDYWPIELAVQEARRESWVRARRDRPDARELPAAAPKLRRRLAGGPIGRSEVEEIAGKGRVVGAGLWLPMVRVPPSGTWERRRADIFGLAEDWVGPPNATADEGLELLVRRYLRGFGPASRDDVASFTGVHKRVLEPVVERVATRRFRDEQGGELVDLPRAPLPDAGTPAPVRFLPTWDATLLAHARRTGILPEEHRPKIFHMRNPQSTATFLVDGEVAGTWRHEGGRIKVEPFGRLDAAARRELKREAEELAELHA
jgi:hypothetical protein